MSSSSNHGPTGPLVLGIDPGLNTTGYGLVDMTQRQPQLVEAGVIRSRRSDELQRRLRSLFDGLTEVLNGLKPDAVAIEELYSHYERPQTAILMGHARGVLCLATGLNDVPLYHYSATQIKKVLTGNGRAPKSQVQLAVTRQLCLADVPEPPDVADALAIAICHAFLSQTPTSLR